MLDYVKGGGKKIFPALGGGGESELQLVPNSKGVVLIWCLGTNKYSSNVPALDRVLCIFDVMQILFTHLQPPEFLPLYVCIYRSVVLSMCVHCWV